MSDLDKAKKIKRKYESKWFEVPEIVSIGIGFVNENTTGIIIGVKKNKEEIAQTIPEEIEGIPIILQIVGRLHAL